MNYAMKLRPYASRRIETDVAVYVSSRIQEEQKEKLTFTGVNYRRKGARKWVIIEFYYSYVFYYNCYIV